MDEKEFFKLKYQNEVLSKQNQKLRQAFDQIVDILEKSNVFASLSGKLFLEDGYEICKIIKKLESEVN